MTTKITGASANAARQVRYDAGPALLNATGKIDGNTDNATIDRMTSEIVSALKKNGVKDTRFVGEMLYQMRGARLGVAGDKEKFVANAKKAAQLGVLGPNGKSQLLSRVGAADNQARNDNSMLNVKNQSQPQKRDLFELPSILKRPQYTQDIFKPTTKKKAETPVKKADVPTPKLDASIDGLDKATKLMPDGAIKQSLTTVKSALELARTAEKNGDKVAYTKAIGSLSQNMFKTIGEVVKSFGQNEELTKAAADQLGKIAGYIGKGVKVVGAIDDLSKVLRGKTLGGEAVNQAKRVDAAINLVTTFLPGPVGTGVSVAKAQLEWCFNNIGVPAKQAMTEYGLKRLFAGKSPEQMREQVKSLPVNDPAKARWALDQLFSKTFPNTTSGFSQATASSMWKQFIAKEMSGYNMEMKLLNENAKTPAGMDPMVDTLRTTMAERYQRAALRFIDSQVSDAKGSWPV